MKKCAFCKEEVDVADHLCSVHPPTEKQAKGPEKFLVVPYNFETYMGERDPKTGKRRLIPYLVTAAVFCEKCFRNEEWNDACETGCKKENMWTNTDEFCKWLFFQLSEQNEKRKVFAFAHNVSKFDSYFLINCLICNKHKPEVTF